MESPSKIPQRQQSSAQAHKLQVDFSWMKFKVLISEKGKQESRPIYIVDYKAFKPNLIFKSAANESRFASGTLHAISINADCEIRGQPIMLKAAKRFRTEYTHLSQAFSDTDNPVPMTWTTTYSFKTWDFICLDPQQMPVAKFSWNIWACNKVGNIEFLGSKAATSNAAREEIVVTGLTLICCMALRMNNILSLLGAMLARPGHADKDTSAVNLEQVPRGNEIYADAVKSTGHTKLSGATASGVEY